MAATGSVFESRGTWFARVSLGDGKRPAVRLPTCTSEKQARARAVLAAELVAALRKAGQQSFTEATLENVATFPDERLPDVRAYVLGKLCSGRYAKVGTQTTDAAGDETFEAFALRWTSGKLHTLWPDIIPKKKTGDEDEGRLRRHVFPVLGPLPVRAVRLEHYEEVMRRIPATKSQSTRRHVAQLMAKVMKIAKYPARLIEVNPLAGVTLPRLTRKALAMLYPSEETALLACDAVPLAHRVLYGLLAREGLRIGEALGDPDEDPPRPPLTWRGVDLERGAIRVVDTKTNEERHWSLAPDVVRALARWRQGAQDDAPMFPGIAKHTAAKELRAHLLVAGIDRPELHETTGTRRKMRVHDLRGLFVTTSLAAGRSEAWVGDRTGHDTSEMIGNYRRAARTWTEMDLGALSPLDSALTGLPAASVSKTVSGGRKAGASFARIPQSFPPVPAQGFEPQFEESKTAATSRTVANCAENGCDDDGSQPLATPADTLLTERVRALAIEIESAAARGDLARVRELARRLGAP